MNAARAVMHVTVTKIFRVKPTSFINWAFIERNKKYRKLPDDFLQLIPILCFEQIKGCQPKSEALKIWHLCSVNNEFQVIQFLQIAVSLHYSFELGVTLI